MSPLSIIVVGMTLLLLAILVGYVIGTVIRRRKAIAAAHLSDQTVGNATELSDRTELGDTLRQIRLEREAAEHSVKCRLNRRSSHRRISAQARRALIANRYAMHNPKREYRFWHRPKAHYIAKAKRQPLVTFDTPRGISERVFVTA